MSKQKVVKVEITELQQILFVRKVLNRDHVEMLAKLMNNNVKLKPITINPANVVIDGRHRIEACELNGISEIECVVETFKDEAEMIARAHQLNAGGALPPTEADMEHTVSMLLSRMVSKDRISDMLGLPKGLANRYIGNIQARIRQRNLNQALSAVATGDFTVTQAAQKYGVDVADLRAAIRGRRRKEKDSLNDSLRGIRSVYNGLTRRTQGLIRKGTEMVQDGLVSPQRVEEIIDSLATLRNNQTRVLTAAKRRFIAAVSSTDE